MYCRVGWGRGGGAGASAGTLEGVGVELAPSVVRSVRLWGSADMRTERTIAAMRQVAADSLRDPAVVAEAVEIVRGADGHDRAALVARLRAWLAQAVRFVPDPLIDGDVIRTPALLLAQYRRTGVIQGDCDDIATLAATLGTAVGVPARFVVLAFGSPDAPYAHVYAELDDGQAWRELDVTETPERRAGVTVSRRMVYPVGPDAGPSLAGLVEGLYVAVAIVAMLKGVRGGA